MLTLRNCLFHDTDCNYFESFPPHEEIKEIYAIVYVCVCVCVLFFHIGFKWNHNLVLLTVPYLLHGDVLAPEQNYLSDAANVSADEPILYGSF